MSIKVNNWVKDEPGIYVIENEDNGMRYVGKAIVSCKSRIEQHIKNLKSGKHSIERLQHDYDFGDNLYFREIYAANYAIGDKKTYDYILSAAENSIYSAYRSAGCKMYNKCIPTLRMRGIGSGKAIAMFDNVAEIQAAADAVGETLNEYIVKAIDERMERK